MNKVIVKGRKVITHSNVYKCPKIDLFKSNYENDNSENNFLLFEGES